MKKKKISILIAVNLITSSLLYVIIKYIVRRPRPYPFRFIVETGYSFPSGHTANNTAFYGLGIYFIWKYIKNKILKILLTILLSLWILLIGTSRIFFNVHYASDVLSGYILGVIVVCGSILVEPKLDKIFK